MSQPDLNLPRSNTRRRGVPEIDVALVVAAVERAGDDWPYGRERRDDYDGPDGSATVEHIRKHLGGGHRARRNGDGWDQWHEPPYDGQVRRALKAAAEAGWVVKVAPPRGVGAQLWLVSAAGDAMLAELDAIEMAPELLESPAHRAWRERRQQAMEELPEIRQKMREEARAWETLAEASTYAELLALREETRTLYTFDIEDALRALDAEEPS